VFLFSGIIFDSCSSDENDKRLNENVLNAYQRISFQSNLLSQLKVVNPQEFNSNTKIINSKLDKFKNLYYLRTLYSNDYVTITLMNFTNGVQGKDSLPLVATSCTSHAC